MPLNIPAGHALVEYHFRYGTDPDEMIATIGMRAISGPFAQLHTARAHSAFVASLLGQLSGTVQLVSTVARVRQDGGGDLIFQVVGAPGDIGGQTSPGISPNVALLIEKLTSRSGRRGKGRMYLPGITEDRVDANGSIPAASLTAIQTECNDYLAALLSDTGTPAGSPVHPVLFHGNTTKTVVTHPSPTQRVSTRDVLGAGPAPDDITAFQPDPVVATQRRRLR